MIWLTGFGVTVREIMRVGISKETAESAKNTETINFQGLASW